MGKIDNFLKTDIIHYFVKIYDGDDRDEYMEILARVPSFPMLRPEVPIAKISRSTGKIEPISGDDFAKVTTGVERCKNEDACRQTWNEIMNENDGKPSKNTALSFAIAFGLDLQETNALLSTVGFTLSHSSKADVIIEYFIANGMYDIEKINDALSEFDQPRLEVQ